MMTNKEKLFELIKHEFTDLERLAENGGWFWYANTHENLKQLLCTGFHVDDMFIILDGIDENFDDDLNSNFGDTSIVATMKYGSGWTFFDKEVEKQFYGEGE